MAQKSRMKVNGKVRCKSCCPYNDWPKPKRITYKYERAYINKEIEEQLKDFDKMLAEYEY